MFSSETKIALESFFVSLSVILIISGVNIYTNNTSLSTNVVVYSTVAVLTCVLLKLVFKGNSFQIALRASFLGTVFALGIYLGLVAPAHICIFGVYMCVMAFFHFSEFVAIAIVQPKQVSVDSFVINHSPQYTVAAITSWLEFFVESYLFPGMKQIVWVSNIGLLICIGGEILRKLSMFTAGTSFHHLVQCEKSKDHVLVTHGVYSWFRHPSYVGWFYWSIGTQILLLNPLCVPAYAVASWLFFKSRVYIEEITLLNFFGQNYCDYQQKVGTGLPFIEGYRI
ncbi:hypothetical protein NQ315_008099 [Exocentrus adspersus]|uniref:Protein-S-isoprenylcysteine O-methyltransferase n=1 Tax=Exocentrus adspersus TaxID=1586481 RepID=A0AAV8VVN2_9CUCU|nr:hypothetical protein NQ315_008099 [Exocentrus adspersus]